MADIPGGGVLMLGGEVGGPPGRFLPELWSFDAQTGWTQLQADAPGQPADGFAYDTESGLSVWVNDQGETFVYDPAAGTSRALELEEVPEDTWGSRMAYDAQSDRIILFGGYDGSSLNSETWALDADTPRWEQRQPAAAPPAQNFHTMAYDPSTDRVVLFSSGGHGTWAYDYETDTWTALAPDPSPSALIYSAMVYDGAAKRMMLFGGLDESRAQASDATWAYQPEGNAWTQLNVTGRPSARAWHSMALDADSGSIVLFSGGPIREQAPLDGVWLFDPATDTWSEWRAP